LTFALVGQKLFTLLGITLPAFKIAASIVLLLIALDMLRAQRSRVRETIEEDGRRRGQGRCAITPLAIPMLAGPGAISTIILLQSQAKGVIQEVALFFCIILVCAISYVILRLAAHGAMWISPIAMKIVTRIMGLLLAAVAIQFMLDALAEQKGRIF
jgi:multiple antibiotic resistance protein